MALKIRMARAGAKKRPYYQIVVADERSPRDGRYIEQLGSHNPFLDHDNPNRVILKIERLKHWLSTGAQVSDRVHSFLAAAGLVKKKLNPIQTKKSTPKQKAQERMKAEEEQRLAAEQAAREAIEAEAAQKAEAEQAIAEHIEEPANADTPAEQEKAAAENNAEQIVPKEESAGEGSTVRE